MSRRKFEMSKEELHHLYIEENMSDTEIAHMAGFKQWQVVMRLRQQYGIKKDRKSVIEKMKRTNVEKYGYTSADYMASMEYYIRDADRFAKILRETSIILEEEIADLKRRKAALAPIEEALTLLEKYRPEKVFYMTGVGSPSVFREDSLGFYVDSAGGPQYFDARTWLDTAFFGPVMTVAADSIAVPADSVAAVDGKEDIQEMR